MKNPEHPAGFSLTETVIALGLFAFCILPIIALVPVGMGGARSVAQESDAANLASSFFGAWELRTPSLTNFPIPKMFTNPPVEFRANTNDMYFAADGAQTTDQVSATMMLHYEVSMSTDGSTASIDLDFYWPAPPPDPTQHKHGTNKAVQKRSFSRTFPL